MARVQDGLYFIAADPALNQLLEPADTTVNAIPSNDIISLLGNLNQPDSSVWKLEAVPQGGRKATYFSITAGDSTALALNEATGGIYLDDLDTSDDHQLWDIRVGGSTWFGANSTLNATIKNKFNKMSLDLDASNSAIGKRGGRRVWRFISLIDTDGGGDSGDDMADITENRNWLRDMLWYFTRRYGRASDGIGFYPFQDGHINYPNTWLLGKRFVRS
ncbi:hypothetical protein EKO27_g6538 [Xylaria grammica]|uniref:Uncharacterized protein n=1 Tax=Xylaria grammica TaxID=363999 RepID=A0A439D2C5_9PEZI|nr:hypothetical protein EKO27_g6538 [Xylaria grammica]